MLPPALRVLRNRQYALVWVTGVFSDVGTWMQAVAVAALVIDLTNSVAWGALAAALPMFMGGLFQPVGGVVADRYDRRQVLMFAAGLQALLAVALAGFFVAGWLSPITLVAIVAAEGVMVAMVLPARSAMLPDLVGEENIVDAAALGTASWNLGRTFGPAAGGVVLLIGSYSWVFLINAVTFVAAAVALAFVRLSPLGHHETGSVWQRLRAGVKGAADDKHCATAIATVAVLAVFIAPFIALVPAMAQIVFGGGPADTAQLVTAQGLGSVAVALTLSSLTRHLGHNRLIRFTLVGLPLAVMAFAVAPTMSSATVALFVVGFMYFGLLINTGVIIQLRAPNHLRGRVLSLQMTTLGVVYGLASAAQGYIGDLVGVRETLFGAAGVFLLVAVVMMFAAPRRLSYLDV